MPGLVPGIQVLSARRLQGVDGRDKPGHDEEGSFPAGMPGMTAGADLLTHRQTVAVQAKSLPCPIAAAVSSLYCNLINFRPVRARGAATLAANRAVLF
jgi:hypothetical protein